jgi:cystathionine beta-lyase/cystathionine gamma-synthase
MEFDSMRQTKLRRATEILYRGAHVKGRAERPETPPIYLTTAFNVQDLDDLQSLYDVKGYTYNRTRNPNRNTLAELMTYLESGEDSTIFSSGMGAISTSMLALLEKGDHVLSHDTLYGETIELFSTALPKYGIEVTFLDFTDLDAVKKAVRPSTKILYTETVSNPMITVVDIEAVAAIAHANGAKLIVDNTFTTSRVIRPLEKGADISINSLTKFANGHSDAVAGSLTGSKAIVKTIYDLQVLLGSTLDGFSAWLVQRGIRTMDLRVQKQLDNAEKLARALDVDRRVLDVHHPSLESHPQHELAKRIFENGYCGMLSFVMPDDKEKINTFMRKLNTAHYAMTLGGYRTSLSHPVSSSHYGISEAQRQKMGITFGLMRVSVGIEDPDDLIADFHQALDVFE